MAIDYPVLDPATDELLVENAVSRAVQASGGQLRDRGPGSVLRALIEGMVFPVAELSYYLNQLPRALALEVFTLLGVTRADETPARGGLTFLLRSPLATTFSVPAGYTIAGPTPFQLLEPLVIAPGALEGTVSVQATVAGSQGNYAPGTYQLSATGFSQVQMIYNKDALTGGRAVEEEADFIERAQAAVSRRNTLVSALDYQLSAEQISGCQAKVLPGLSGDRITLDPLSVAVFLAPEVGQASLELCDSVRTAMLPATFAGSSLAVLPALPQEVEINVVCKVDQVSAAQAQAIADALSYVLSPLRYPIGEPIRVKNLEYVVQSVPGVTELSDLRINGSAVDYLFTAAWVYPRLGATSVTISDSYLTKTYVQGNGQGITD